MSGGSYELFVEPDAHRDRLQLPGHVRQRLHRLVAGLSTTPRPADSAALRLTESEMLPGIELRRIRLDKWRVAYAVNDADSWVWVLAVRRRPPYAYEDLRKLAERLG